MSVRPDPHDHDIDLDSGEWVDAISRTGARLRLVAPSIGLGSWRVPSRRSALGFDRVASTPGGARDR